MHENPRERDLSAEQQIRTKYVVCSYKDTFIIRDF